jgi:hypothetical protein
VTLDHIDPMCSLSLSSVHIALHAIILHLSLILRIWVNTWLVMLSLIVMSVKQAFHLYVVVFGLCYCRELVFHPSRCEVTVVRIDAVV